MRNFTRRDFLKQALATLGVALVPYPLRVYAQSGSAGGKRQHLINVCDLGGWDMNWFVYYFDPNLNSRVSQVPWNATYRNTDNSIKNPDHVKPRYPSGTAVSFDGKQLAPGMKFWTAQDLAKLCLWSTRSATGHTQQSFYYRGGVSPYMASASSLIAAYQAQTRGPSPLHYVKLATTPSSVPPSSGMLTGLAIANCIADQTSWQTMTNGAAGGLTDAQIIQDAVQQLSTAARNRLTRSAPVSLVDGYKNSFAASQILARSGYATGEEFLALWMRYFNAIVQEAKDHIASGLGSYSSASYVSAFVAGNGTPNSRMSSLSGITLPTTVAQFNTLRGTLTAGYQPLALSIAWRFAMAAFLVIKDLSAVVDFVASGSDDQFGDVHENTGEDVCRRMIGLAGYRELIRHLGSTPVPGGSGTLLDITLITYTSEFSRSGFFNSDQAAGGWGTTHNSNWPIFISGHRSMMGKFFGAIKTGDSVSIPSLYRCAPFPSETVDTPISPADWFGTPIAQDPASGAVIGGNNHVSPFALFPTIMAMFGAPIPLQQITEHKALSWLIRA